MCEYINHYPLEQSAIILSDTVCACVCGVWVGVCVGGCGCVGEGGRRQGGTLTS